MTFCACTSSGETARASSSTVSSPAAAVSCGRNPMVAFFSIVIVPLSGETSPRRRANKVDLPAPFGPTNPIRSPRLTWSDTSSKSARPAKDFESCETVSIADSAQCPLVRCPAQLVNHESTRMNTNHIARAVARIPLAETTSRLFIAAYLSTDFVQRYFTNELRTVSQPTLNIKQI